MRKFWLQIESLLDRAERPARYLNHEWGCERNTQAFYHFCMVYPDTYELGQANQAVRILCNVVNADETMDAQRAFLPAPEFGDLMREEGVPLCSLESCSPLSDFDVVGITLSHELAATNVLEVLDLSGIPFHADERGEDDPLVFAGGPCVLNPEPYAPFFDLFSIGEGEEAVPELLKRHKELKEQGVSRSDILRELAQIPGTYVPSLYDFLEEDEAQDYGAYVKPKEVRQSLRVSDANTLLSPQNSLSPHEGGSSQRPIGQSPMLSDDLQVECDNLLAPSVIRKRIFEGFAQSPAFEPCIVPFAEVVHDRLNVEVLRGCTRGCRFCQAGMMYRPVRERSVDNIIAGVEQGLAETGYDEVSLTSLSTTDHSQIGEILDRLNVSCANKGIQVSIPSQRLDSFGVDMATKVAGQKRGGLTFAPEAGSQRLRDAINKNVTEEDLLQAVEAAFKNGWRRCKLYFMIGLPTETDEDVRAIARLAEAAYAKAKESIEPSQKGSIKLGISCALFVPKPQTPFQWDAQIGPDEALRRVGLVRETLRSRAIDLSWHDPQTSYIESALSRGGRKCARWIEAAWKHGARFDAWTEHYKAEAWDKAAEEVGFDARKFAQQSFALGSVLPWQHIDMGVSQEFLKDERQYAETGQKTPDCTFDTCVDCGVCPQFNVGIEVQGVRLG